MLRSLSGGLRSLFRKEQVSQELDEEPNDVVPNDAQRCPAAGGIRLDGKIYADGPRFWELGLQRSGTYACR